MLVLLDSVTLHNATIVTDSRRVAKHFGKRHDNVLRAIRNLDCSPEFRRLNFEERFEINELANGKPEPFVKLTKDGFVFAVMGFTGKEAARIKESYINAFNAMAEQLSEIERGGFLSFWEQCLELEKRDDTSFKWAQFGSRKMLDRRRELPGIASERARLNAQMQQPIPGTEVPATLTPAPQLKVVGKERASNDSKKKRAA